MRTPPFRILLVSVLLASSSPAGQQALLGVRKLNEPLMRPTLGDLKEALITPDGSEALYRADLDTDEIFELYASPMDGSGGARRLSIRPIAPEGQVGRFEIAPGGSRVVYTGDLILAGRNELFSCALDGSGTKRLNGTAPHHVKEFRISADGSRVAYVADEGSSGVNELFGVRTDGSAAPTRLSGVLVSGGDVKLGDFALTPDGGRVAYVADQETDGVLELYSSDGLNPPTKLNPTLVAGGDIGGSLPNPIPRITADGARVVYVADQAVDEVTELYSVAVDGSQAAVRISAPLFPGDRVVSFRVSDDGRWAVYLTSNTGLFSVPTDASAPALALAGLPYQDVYRIDPTSRALVYLRPSSSSQNDVYARPLDGSHAQVRLNPTPAWSVRSFEIDPLGQRVVFRFDRANAPLQELAMAPIDGSAAAIVLTVPAHALAEVQEYGITGSTVAFISDQESDEVNELFRVPIDGSGAPARISDTLVPFGDVSSFQVDPDGHRVLYRADQEADTVLEYFSVPLAGGSRPVRVNDPLPPGPIEGDVYSYLVSKQAGRAVYVAGVLDRQDFELRSVPLSGGSPAVKLSLDTEIPTAVFQVRITPDGARVVHGQGTRLYGGPIDGGSPPTLLGEGESLAGGTFLGLDPLISPDGARVVYRSHFVWSPANHQYGRLFGTLIDGSLSPYPVSSGGARDYVIDPSSTRVAYLSGSQLYSRALDASAPEVWLDGPPVAGGGVAGFQLTPDGTTVLYTADQEVDGLVELYRVPIDRSAPPLELSAPTVGVGVSEVRVTADSRLAVWKQATASGDRLLARPIAGSEPARFLAALEPHSGQLQLTPGGRAVYMGGDGVVHSVPLDGSTGPVDLGSGDGGGLRVSRDGNWAVYQAGVLVAVRTDGSSPPHPLSPTGTSPQSFAFTPDSRGVVFIASARIPRTVELFAVAIDRPAPPLWLSAKMVADGDVADFQVMDSGGLQVLYRADGEVDGVVELFAARAKGDPFQVQRFPPLRRLP